MKRTLMAAAAVALVLASITAASAQQQRRGGFGQGRGGMFGGGIQMLRIAEVQLELKMTEAQVAKLDVKQDEIGNAMREIFQSAGGNPQDISPEDRAKLMAKIAEVQSKAVADVLDATQLKRYKQLVLQREGPLAVVTNKEAADALKITDAQRQQIGEIQRGVMQEQRSAREGFDFRNASAEDRAKMNAKTEEIRAKASAKVIALFTEDQKKTWNELTGAPFKFPPPQRPAA